VIFKPFEIVSSHFLFYSPEAQDGQTYIATQQAGGGTLNAQDCAEPIMRNSFSFFHAEEDVK
jgi:hypothetical protein